MGAIKPLSPNEIADPCVPPPVQRVLRRVANNTTVNQAIEGDVYNNLFAIPGANPASPFIPVPGEPGEDGLSAVSPPFYKIQLTSHMADIGGGVYKASAKLRTWGVSGYVLGSTAFDVYDICDKWHHARSGDRGYVQYDRERAVLFAYDLNTVSRRKGTITGALTSHSSVSGSNGFTDSNDGAFTQITVYGDFVMSGKKVAAGSTVGISWFPNAGKWIVDVVESCLVDDP